MSEPKSVGGAYAYALVGVLFGAFGVHRFYVGRMFSGFVLSALSIGAVIAFFLAAAGLTSSLLSGYVSAIGGDFTGLAEVERIATSGNVAERFEYVAYFGVPALLWFALDMLLLPSMVRKANAELTAWRTGAQYSQPRKKGVLGGGEKRIAADKKKITNNPDPAKIPDFSDFQPEKLMPPKK